MNENIFPALSDPAYRIEAELGAGGGGVVYKAWHTRLQKYVVLKRIKDESGLLQSSRQRGEADILKNLKHANLPQLYDFLEDPGGVYTVMELIPGQSFADLLKNGQRFSQQQAVHWAEQLSSALAYLHAQTPPVLHSDIKPGNIMLTPEGDVCLIDFNISLVLAGEDTEMLGLSHGYASPEQYGPQELPRQMQVAPGRQAASGGYAAPGGQSAQGGYASPGGQGAPYQGAPTGSVETQYQAGGMQGAAPYQTAAGVGVADAATQFERMGVGAPAPAPYQSADPNATVLDMQAMAPPYSGVDPNITVYSRTDAGTGTPADAPYQNADPNATVLGMQGTAPPYAGAVPGATDFSPGVSPLPAQYMPQQPAYAPQQPAYAPQQPAYAPQQPAYAPQPAPSSVQRRAAIRMDTRSDIYSLGATLYHIVTGEKPAIATGQIKPLSKCNVRLSKAFTYIIERCMERDPAKRFQSAAALHEAVADIHKLDGRWKSHRTKAVLATVVLAALFALSCLSAFLGWTRMGEEAVEAYNGYLLRITGEDGEAAYNEAVALFPENPAAYRERALRLYQAGAYVECIDYVRESLAKLSAYGHDAIGIRQIGELYYLRGSAYFELEDYANSISAFAAAWANAPENDEILRDYAIALARGGYIDRAEAMLDDMIRLNPGNDSIQLLRGEIAFAAGDDESAVTLLKEAIRDTGSDAVRYRAYLLCDRAYRRLPDRIDEEIALMQDALRDLPANYAFFAKERLADAYARAGDYDEAVVLYEEFRRSGSITYQTWQNIAALYQKMGGFADARAVYLEMRAAYPGDYRPPMRLAYLVLEEQGALPNDARDYTDAALYYEQALALCTVDDMEMTMLGSLVAELRQNGWIGP